jgi:hypothetical protein
VLLDAIPHIAKEWRKYAEPYEMDLETAEWRHPKDPTQLSTLSL